MQQQVYQVHGVDELKQRFIDAWHGFEQSLQTRSAVGVLQDSGETPLMCGKMYDMNFVAHFMENTTEKKFWKSVNIWQTYERMYSSGTVFIETQCI